MLHEYPDLPTVFPVCSSHTILFSLNIQGDSLSKQCQTASQDLHWMTENRRNTDKPRSPTCCKYSRSLHPPYHQKKKKKKKKKTKKSTIVDSRYLEVQGTL